MTKKGKRQKLYYRLKDLENLSERERKRLENLTVDEALEQLDHGSPKLNWIYVILAVTAIFFIAWLVIESNPRQDEVPPNTIDEMTEEISTMQEEISSLEQRISTLEGKGP